MKRLFWAMLPASVLAACTSTPPPVANTPASIPTRPAPPISASGLEAVMGKNIAALKSLFGEPRLNVKEPVGRKLQFVGTACILDTYLYPEGSGGSEVVTHVDARRRDGAEVDRASCVNALMRR